MKLIKPLFFLFSFTLFFIACKSTRNTPSSSPVVKTPKGYFEPGEEQYAAIQEKYSGTSLTTLKEGHALYIGVCNDCHKVHNIYNFTELRWMDIIPKMAVKSKMTDAQQDAVTKYVMSMKATQPPTVN